LVTINTAIISHDEYIVNRNS